VHEITDVNDAASHDCLRVAGMTHMFLLGWSQLLTDATLALATGGVFGGHPSALPFGRGRAPVPWTILQELDETAVSIFRATRRVDAGPIVYQRKFSVPPRVDARQLYDRCAAHLSDGFVALARSLRDGVAFEERPQNVENGTVRARRVPSDGLLDFSAPAADLDRLVRAVTKPSPGAYAYYGDDRVVVWKSEPTSGDSRMGLCGQVLARSDDAVLVQTGDEPLWLSGLERSGVTVLGSSFALGSRFGVAVQDEVVRLRREVARLSALLETVTNHA
jgi:methionyl-tRNA formyltransferase